MRIIFGLTAPPREILDSLKLEEYYVLSPEYGPVIKENGLYIINFPDYSWGGELKSTIVEGRQVQTIYSNGVLLIRSEQKSATEANAVVDFTFTIDKQAVYRHRLYNAIIGLKDIVLGSGAQRGFGSWIPVQLQNLRALRYESPSLHDAFIATNDKYKKLWKLFPNWIDSHNLQSDFVQADVGVFLAMAGHARSGLPFRALDILADGALSRALEEEAEEEARAKQASKEELDRIRPQLLAALNRYSNPYKLSIFGHHHEARDQAIMNAIRKAPSIAEVSKILTHQLSLMCDRNPSLTEDIDPSLLSQRWCGQLPVHRTLTVTLQNKSGYVRALRQALQVTQATALSTNAPTSRVDAVDASALLLGSVT